MIHSYFNRYLIHKNAEENLVTHDAIDQQSIKNCIRDFNQGMIDAGMIKTTVVEQLDLNNIPDMEYWNNTNDAVGIVYFNLKPLIYTFGDDLNLTHPLYIKIIFNYKSTATRVTGSKVNNLILSATLYFSKSIDFPVAQTHTMISYFGTFYADMEATSFLYNRSVQVNSEIIIGDISSFNICPYTSYQINKDSVNTNSSLISFIVDRQNNGDVIVITSSGGSSNPSGNNTMPTIDYYYTYTAYIYANGTIYADSSNNIFQSMSESQSLNNQQEMYLSASQYSGTEKNNTNYNILNGNLNFFPSTANKFIIKVKLPDGNFYRYKLIRYPIYPYSFYQDTVTSTRCILIKLRDDDV